MVDWQEFCIFSAASGVFTGIAISARTVRVPLAADPDATDSVTWNVILLSSPISGYSGVAPGSGQMQAMAACAGTSFKSSAAVFAVPVSDFLSGAARTGSSAGAGGRFARKSSQPSAGNVIWYDPLPGTVSANDFLPSVSDSVQV